jgi:serine/threonine protein phosphatase PrpC
LGRNGRAVQVSRDHNADKNFGTADFDAEEVYIHDERLQVDDEFLILMSDGVYNAFKDGNDGVVRYVRERLGALGKSHTNNNVAAQLVRYARQLEDAVAKPESKIDDMSAVVVVLRPTSETGPLLAWDEEEEGGAWGAHPHHNGTRSRITTTRIFHLLTSIPRWQCALVAAMLCVALTIGLLFSLRG